MPILVTAAEKEPPATSQEGDLREKVLSLREEVLILREYLQRYGERLASLERARGQAPQMSAPPSGPHSGVAAPALEWEGPTQGPFFSISEWLQRDWEKIPGNWFSRIGALALVIGVGFFLALAIENDWIAETGQVVLGVIGGMVLLG